MHSSAEAADAVVERCFNEDVFSRIVARVIEADRPSLVVMPHPEFDAGQSQDATARLPKNMIPIAFANRLARRLGCKVDEEIIETARPGRTKLRVFPRFLWQPRFTGAVRTDHAYILVDDVSTIGSTMASLRSYIAAGGGTVIAATALASRLGVHQKFPIAEEAVNVLKARYGEALDVVWYEEVGHVTNCLTSAEGSALSNFAEKYCADCGDGDPALQRLRNRLAQAAAKAR